MADIDVERKGSSLWWWLLGLLVLLVILWALWLALSDGDEPEVVEPATPVAIAPAPVATGTAALPPAVSTYLQQCTEELGAPEGDMGLEHQYTVNCLQQLGTGVSALIEQEQVANTDVSAAFERYNGAVQQLQASQPAATNHANLTRDAAGTATELMQAMQTAWYGANAQVQGAVSEAQQAAQGIQGTTPMLEQRESVRTFFREAGDALRAMAEGRAGAV